MHYPRQDGLHALPRLQASSQTTPCCRPALLNLNQWQGMIQRCLLELVELGTSSLSTVFLFGVTLGHSVLATAENLSKTL